MKVIEQVIGKGPFQDEFSTRLQINQEYPMQNRER
jgi:hypothetical protein